MLVAAKPHFAFERDNHAREILSASLTYYLLEFLVELWRINGLVVKLDLRF